MDRALFDVAHLIADLTYVDGAVLMTDRVELLGFGVEISGGLPEVSTVARARDLAGTERGAGANRPGGYTPSLGLPPLPRASGRPCRRGVTGWRLAFSFGGITTR
jgi:hypothetical protein